MALGGQSEGRKSKVGSAKPAAVRLGCPGSIRVAASFGFRHCAPIGYFSLFPTQTTINAPIRYNRVMAACDLLLKETQ